MQEDRERLLELYRMHTEEVRFQIQLGWDRAKSSLAFHAALLAFIVGVPKISPLYARWMFVFLGISALFCAVMVHLGHVYYRAARDQRRRIEEQLGETFRFVATPGQRGEARRGLDRFWPKITTILVMVHVLIAGLCLVG